MTPLERARAEAEKINYCDECQHFTVVGESAFCEVSGKYLHPLMMMRGKGTGPAYHCKKAKRKEKTDGPED